MAGKGKGSYTWHDYLAAYCAGCNDNYISVDTVEIQKPEEELTGIICSADLLPNKPLSADKQVIKKNACKVLGAIAQEIVSAVLFGDDLPSPKKGMIGRKRVVRYFNKIYGKEKTEQAIKEIKYFIDLVTTD